MQWKSDKQEQSELKESLKLANKLLKKAFEAGKSQADADRRNWNGGFDKEHSRYDKLADLTFEDWLSQQQ